MSDVLEVAFLKFAADFLKHPDFEKLSDNAKEVFLKTAKISFKQGWHACCVELQKEISKAKEGTK